MNRFLNLLNLVPPPDPPPPPPKPLSLAPFDTFRSFNGLPVEIQTMVWAHAFHGFARVDSTFPPPDTNLFPFDALLFRKDLNNRKNIYRTTEPNLITIRIKFHPIFINRRPLQGMYVRGRPYSRRRIDLKFSMFTPNPEYDPARVMRLLNTTSKDLYESYKPRFLQLGDNGPKIFFNPERDFVEMDEVSLFLLGYYDNLTPANLPTDIKGFNEIRNLQLGMPTFRFPQYGTPPPIAYRGIEDLRKTGRRVLESVVFPEDENPNVARGPVLRNVSPYFRAMSKILLYMSGQADDDPQYHTFPNRYRLSWEEVVDARAFDMTTLALTFYQ
ncbi:hypothetical protein BKA65DRAFT_470985 [Rhexocercosporidium sp. MPI-PUGE-AT-0058]|nr:hypothetical protein BKA65DRAFT_470985 [Rhexocercosporidium sp. MPI-PUGE-AT-0058]